MRAAWVHKSVYLHAAAVISALHKEIVLLSLPFVVPFVAYCCHSLLPPSLTPCCCCSGCKSLLAVPVDSNILFNNFALSVYVLCFVLGTAQVGTG